MADVQVLEPAATAAEAEVAAGRPIRDRVRFRGGWATVGALIFGAIVLAAILGPTVRPDADAIDLMAISQPPSWAHPFGTDPSRPRPARARAVGRAHRPGHRHRRRAAVVP